MATPVEEQLKRLPAKPGVYLFRDDGARFSTSARPSRRPRVRSYSRRHPTRAPIQRLPERVADVEVIVTNTEPRHCTWSRTWSSATAALQRSPAGRQVVPVHRGDGRGTITRASCSRESGTGAGSSTSARTRTREGTRDPRRAEPRSSRTGRARAEARRHGGIPCLDYHIERCLAPCVGYVSKEGYRQIIDGVIEFLSGETRPIQRELERKMNEAAEAERFEEAARYRNRLFAVRHLVERQAADRRSVGSVDVIGIAVDRYRAAVQVFPLRDGRLIDRYAFHLENVEGQDTPTLLEAFATEYYGSSPSVPPQIVVPPDSGDTSALEEFLTERRGSRVEVRAPSRGEKRRLQGLATENARLALESEAVQSGKAVAARSRRWRSCGRR